MIIWMTDGSKLTCSHIVLNGDELICDDYRIVDADDVDYIEEK